MGRQQQRQRGRAAQVNVEIRASVEREAAFAVGRQRCHPLTVLDDHSRYNLVLDAVHAERFEVVQPCLQRAFQRYGLPWRINTDNGPPWGTAGRVDVLSRLGVWLIRLGIRLSNSRPAQ